MQISLGLPDPREASSLPTLKRVQAGIKRAQLHNRAQNRLRLPITASILLRIRDTLEKSNHPQKVLIWAVACAAFFVFSRLGELLPENSSSAHPATSLMWGDVTVDDPVTPKMVKFHLKKAKCDQFGKGVDVIVGRTHQELCPVTALVSFMAYRGSKPGPFFTDSDSKVWLKCNFVDVIRHILRTLGLPQDQYAGHSFRIGAATSAAQAGIADSTIQTLGRWQSSAFLQYIRMPKESLAGVSRTLASQVPTPKPRDGSERLAVGQRSC